MDVYGEILHLLSNLLKFRLRVRLKRWNDRGEFEIDRAKSKNNIAENSFELGHETDNTFDLYYQSNVLEMWIRSNRPNAII